MFSGRLSRWFGLNSSFVLHPKKIKILYMQVTESKKKGLNKINFFRTFQY